MSADRKAVDHYLLFSDHFGVDPAVVEAYGAFNVSLVADLPLFIDPFLLFNSDRPEYQRLHEETIAYLRFLYEKSTTQQVDTGLLDAWYRFKEVKQTWLGFSAAGNRGSGLGPRFAAALNANFPRVVGADGRRVTAGEHLEKLCLIADRVGRDNISDFTTNLIKHYLLEYTQEFARRHVPPDRCRTFLVTKARFSYRTESWETLRFDLPAFGSDFVLLVPADILTRDDTWINRADLLDSFSRLPPALPDAALRAQVENYFRSVLPPKPKQKEAREAARRTIGRFPVLIDYYIKLKEETGERAQSVSGEKVNQARQLFLQNFPRLVALLEARTDFYREESDSYEAALARARYLKQVIENNDGYRLFYDGKGVPIQREEDLQIAFRFTWFGTGYDVNREVNNGRGPVDYKVSRGAADKALVEFQAGKQLTAPEEPCQAGAGVRGRQPDAEEREGDPLLHGGREGEG